ncbi:MAG: hypothetical protein AAFN41_07870 [Planctomycetota bacterium]
MSRIGTRIVLAFVAAVLVPAGLALLGGCTSAPRTPARPNAPIMRSALWSAEAGGLCVELDALPSASSGAFPGEGVQLRLSGPSLSRPVFAVPPQSGETCIPLARTPAEYRALEPGPIALDALIDGELFELAERQLDAATIDRMASVALARGLAVRGAGGPGGEARVEIRLDPPTVRAGESFIVRGTATNTGERTVYGVEASLTPSVSGRALEPTSLEFGWLEPGESIDVTTPMILPRSVREEAVTFEVAGSERHDAAVTSPDSVRLSVAPLPPPALRTAVTITPDRHGRFVREGAENKFRPGDDLQVVCEVTNFGDSTLVGGVARLRMPAGEVASIRAGQSIIGDLPPAASTRAHFWFVVKAPVGSGTVPLVIEIEDSDLGVVHEQAIVLEIEDG